MRRILLFLLTALALLLSSAAQAQSLNDIQRLEEQVQRAKQYGDWAAVSALEPQLNRARLQYQRTRGMGEVSDNGYYNPGSGYYNPGSGYYNPDNGYYNPGDTGYYYPNNGGQCHPNTGYYNPNNNGYIYPANSGYYSPSNGGYSYPGNGRQHGYYDRNGRWRAY